MDVNPNPPFIGIDMGHADVGASDVCSCLLLGRSAPSGCLEKLETSSGKGHARNDRR